MLKKIATVTITIGAIFLLSGCGAKPTATIMDQNVKNPTIAIKIFNGAGTPSYSANKSEAFENALETSATITLQKGFKYFAIVEPKGISNVNGSLKNTAKELLEKCTSNPLLALSFNGGVSDCGAKNTYAYLTITLYNEEQNDFTVIDAQKIIDYFKANGLYEGDGVDVVEAKKNI